MRYLVTGGAGFIGSHIVERLLKDGHFVRVLDNFSSGKRENLSFATKGLSPQILNTIQTKGTVPETIPDFELIEGDIRDPSTCQKACQNIDYVLHQAALRSVPKSMQDPQSYNDVNIGGTLNMLQAAAKAKVKRFVFASSSSVYGDIDKFPEKEDFLPEPISPYALTKLTGEYYCRIFSEHFNLETVCLRYFNVFGPRQALDDEYAVVIPKFIHCILHDEQPPIFGTGKQSRDFTYIDNVVQANILAATVPLKGLSPQREIGTVPADVDKLETKGTVPDKVTHLFFNVANGKDNTVLQLVDYLNKIIGKEIKPVFLPPRPGDVFRTCADISRGKKILNFTPKVNFEEALRKTVNWFKANS
jgi:nucleoside-diphosphate-sugar epimerase